MLINNTEKDIRFLCIEHEVSQKEIADRMGTTPQYVNRIITTANDYEVVRRPFVKMLEVLGYDIKLVYVKKGEKEE